MAHGTKNTLLEGKQRSGTLKRKDISYLNDVISLFLISCPTASFAIQVFLSVTVSRKGTIGHAK